MSAARIILTTLSLFMLVVSLGCERETVVEVELIDESAGTSDNIPEALTDSAEPPAEVKAIELTTADHAQLQEIIAQHEGKIVVVDYWATWCTTCMALMPHTAELQQQHSDDLVVITMCLDDAEQEPTAKEFLARLDGEFTNLMSAVGGGPKTLDEYKLNDGIPHYKFYDREGKLVKELDTDLEHYANRENIDAAVEELLSNAESPAS